MFNAPSSNHIFWILHSFIQLHCHLISIWFLTTTDCKATTQVMLACELSSLIYSSINTPSINKRHVSYIWKRYVDLYLKNKNNGRKCEPHTCPHYLPYCARFHHFSSNLGETHPHSVHAWRAGRTLPCSNFTPLKSTLPLVSFYLMTPKPILLLFQPSSPVNHLTRAEKPLTLLPISWYQT